VIERGADGLAHAYQAALMQRTAYFRQVQRLFESYDVLVMPTLSAPALPATHKAFDELTIGNVAAGTPRYSWYPYTHPFNVTGHPAMSVPVGWSREESPIGLQIVGPWHGEDRMISVAALLEELRENCLEADNACGWDGAARRSSTGSPSPLCSLAALFPASYGKRIPTAGTQRALSELSRSYCARAPLLRLFMAVSADISAESVSNVASAALSLFTNGPKPIFFCVAGNLSVAKM
jgi:hypothetical protein